MNDHLDTASQPQAPATKASGRRRFLGAGVVGAPAVLTLVSQPALGVTCFTPSRSLSRNTSLTQQGKYSNCSGAESPGNYMARATGVPGHSWPSAIPSTTPFHPTFSGAAYMYTKNSKQVSRTMMEVLNLTNGTLPFFLIAAYLNANGGNGAMIPAKLDPNSALTTSAMILQIYTEWRTKGYFEPSAGIQWYADDIKNYLYSNGFYI